MSDQSKIEWCDSTFNPWIEVCTKVGPGCDHCYAEADFDHRKHRAKWGPGNPRSRTSAANWRKPLVWNRKAEIQESAWVRMLADTGLTETELQARGFIKPRRPRVFCASLADVFDNEVPAEWRADLFSLIERTPHLDWLLLTKRIGNAAPMMFEARGGHLPLLPNVWIGATVVTQEEADRDVPKLLRTPAAVRFLSMEPLLGPIDLTRVAFPTRVSENVLDCRTSTVAQRAGIDKLNGIDWVIVGGESGPHARPMHPDWVRSIRDQCAGAGVPFLFKQWGEWAPGESVAPWGWPRQAQGATLFNDRWVTAPADLSEDAHRDDEPDLYRVGKRAAGRALDGVTHDGYPVSQ